MFLDRECHGYLQDEPLRSDVVAYECAAFSRSNRDDLLSYLDDLEASVAPEHRDLVFEVYGENWLEPYETLFAADEEE